MSVTLLACSAKILGKVKATILTEIPSACLLTFSINVTSHQDIACTVEATLEEFGGIDIVMANAGILTKFDKCEGFMHMICGTSNLFWPPV